MPERIPQSIAIKVPVFAVLASDHLTPATGKTIPITISKNGAAFGNPSVGATNATSIGNGWYYVDLSTTDTGTVGPVIVHGAEATIDNIDIAYNVTADASTFATAMLDLAAGVETGLTVRQAMRLMAAVLYGKTSGMGTTTAIIRDTGDTVNRVTATIDINSNRTAVTLNSA